MGYIKQLISYLGLHIYIVQPLSRVWWYMGLGLAIWTALAILFDRIGREKLWRRCNGWIAAAYMVLLLYMTVAARSETAHGGVMLRPLYSFYLARTENREYYRTMLMNVFLFFPLGLTLPFGLSGGKHPVLCSLALGMLLSIGIETLQYIFSLGWAETDDVIMNTLGVLVGSAAYGILSLRNRQDIKRQDDTYGE